MIAEPNKRIIFLGKTFAGRFHDYTLLKEELPPQQAWFSFLHVLVDLGYQGILKDYVGEQIHLPHKKPRKTKKKPFSSFEQKAENRALSKIRVFVENAICGLKRYNVLVHRFRNHKLAFDDEVIALAAALWNFYLCY